MPHVLDDHAIAHYRDKGWVALGSVLDAHEVESLAREEERFRLDRGFGLEANQNLRVN